MPKPRWEDLDAFLSLEEFAIKAVLTLAGGKPGPSFPVIFDDPYFDADLGDYVETTSVPRFWAKEPDMAGAKKHDVIEFPDDLPGKHFELVKDPQPDGTGGVIVYMAFYTDDHE